MNRTLVSLAIACLAASAAVGQDSDAYVRRGLVAHWDAIDNVGVGVHDAAATTWVDLTGNGFDWTLDTGKVAWGADKLTFNGSGDGSGKVPGTSAKSPSDFDGGAYRWWGWILQYDGTMIIFR